MNQDILFKTQDDGTIKCEGKCRVTGRPVTLVVKAECLKAYYENHALVQDAFPNLSKDDREFFISGISPEGWKKLYTLT